jgi:hypothetical protein
MTADERLELYRQLHTMKVDPDQLIDYLKQKIAEDRAILKVYPNVLRTCEYYLQDQKLMNVELFILRLDGSL